MKYRPQKTGQVKLGCDIIINQWFTSLTTFFMELSHAILGLCWHKDGVCSIVMENAWLCARQYAS